MPHRVVESDSDASDGEGGSNRQTRQTRSNGVRVKQEKQRATTEEQDDDDMYGDEPTQEQRRQAEEQRAKAQHSDDEEDEEEGTPRGNKRQRVNDAGDSRSTSSPGPSGERDESAPPRVKVKTLPRDVDGFIPGSIVRIQLKNFVTYDFVEFRPGAFLNMIIGPNGTGKSSIACAIALGLNFPPKILGRATEINAFVKNGTESGHIEIELKGKNKRNLVIRRTLSAKDKKSSFTLNGEPATGREINEKMAELNVQVENLCSFLPQDKVSSFAAMTPQQLLVETQKAAGDPNLTNWFEALKEEGTVEKKLRQKLKEDEAKCEQMRQRNDGIARDVERFKERKRIEKEIEILNVLIPPAKYREMRKEYLVLKRKQRKLHARVVRLKNKNAPAHDRLAELEVEVKEAGKKREKLKKALVATHDEMKKRKGDCDSLERESEKLTNELDGLKKEERRRLSEISKLESNIAETEAELAKPKPEEIDCDARDVMAERKETHTLMMNKKLEFDRLNEETHGLIKQKVHLAGNITNVQKSIAALAQPEQAKLENLRQWDSDVYEAVLWLRQNKNLFKMEVFEPPMLSCSVKDMSFAAHIEACFSGNQLKTFVTQCREDLHTLNKHINDSATKDGRRIRVPTWWRTGGAARPPMTPEQLAELGFEGYAIDFLRFPQGMQDFLTLELNLHRTAISRNPNVDVNRAMDYVGHGGGGSFINGYVMNTVTRSRYGRRAISNLTREISHKPHRFGTPAVDPAVEERYQAQIRQFEVEIGELVKQIEVNDPTLKRLSAELEPMKQRVAMLDRKIARMKKWEDDRLRVEARLTRLKENLTKLRNAPPVDERRKTLKALLVKVSEKRVKLAREILSLSRKMMLKQIECSKAGFELLQLTANRDHLKALCDEKDAKHQQAAQEFNKVHAEFAALKLEVKKFVNGELHTTISEASEEARKIFKETEEAITDYERKVKKAKASGMPIPEPDGVDLRTVAELEDELATLNASLSMIMATNPGVLEEYEQRERSIEQLKETIDQLNTQIESSARRIKATRDKWQPALEKLVASIGERFSAAFDRIGCAGEIRIREEEDYDKWAIEIYVKFRDTEKLQLLTSHRQSGGERSLTTILYLMSLTEEARAPFSLVDEINQGMDQRAERVVHNSMVDVTCKEDSAQYFLITPKLLTDLKYHERMKILCVNNGEWLPEERGVGSMMNMIEGYVQKRNQGGRGTM
ncbi:chromosome structural maintenance protein smc5 [Coprinopsis cinerea AmutBmut pab1-1]|nr:chromosome structural maintenance protein smc5 [Coprinopsis cinerea AmutBmut pab1-1]